MKSFNVDDLAQEIRRVDGNHTLGAGALAEALIPFLASPLLQRQGAEQTAAKLKPTGTGIYAWVADGGAALVMVNKRPSNHSPGGMLNGHLMSSTTFYDGCAVEKWTGGKWFGPLTSDAAVLPQVVEAKPELEWSECLRISGLAEESIRAFSEDPTEDNAACMVREILRAAAPARLGDETPFIYEVTEPCGRKLGMFKDLHGVIGDLEIKKGYTVKPLYEHAAPAGLGEAKAVVPEGWKLVPIMPTEAMHAAAVRTIVRCNGNDDFPPRVYAAMLAAAPAAQALPAGAEDGAWHWVLKEDIGGNKKWVPARRNDNHWDSAMFRGLTLSPDDVGPAISMQGETP